MGDPKVNIEYMREYETLMKKLYPEKYANMCINYNTEKWVEVIDANKKGKNQAKNTKKNKYTTEYINIRPYILERDEYKCIMCGTNKNLHVHHIVERNQGGTNDINNLQTLCKWCHAGKHKGQTVYKIMIKMKS